MSRSISQWYPIAAVALAIAVSGGATNSLAQNRQDQQGQFDSSLQQQDQNGQGFQQDRQQPQQNRNQGQTRQDQQQFRGSQQQFDEDRPQDAYRGDEQNMREQSNQDSRRQQDGQRMQSREQGERRQSDAPAGLGVSVIEGDRGLYVRKVATDSPAEQAGIRRGDEILAINGRRVDTGNQLVQVISQEQPGTEVEILVDRNGQQQTLFANLQTRREALQFEGRQPQGEVMRGPWQEDFEFARGNSPPWNADDIQRHVDELERQVQRMQQEIQDLRRMLNDDPGRRRFNQETVRTESNRDSRMNATGTQDSQQQGFERDQQNRARPNYDDPNFE